MPACLRLGPQIGHAAAAEIIYADPLAAEIAHRLNGRIGVDDDAVGGAPAHRVERDERNFDFDALNHDRVGLGKPHVGSPGKKQLRDRRGRLAGHNLNVKPFLLVIAEGLGEGCVRITHIQIGGGDSVGDFSWCAIRSQQRRSLGKAARCSEDAEAVQEAAA